jgi:hypothetical protein
VGVAGLLVVALGAQGCAAIGLVVLGTAGGVAAGQGTAYTLDGIAYRTFTAPMEQVRRATHTTCKRMDMALKTDEVTDTGRELVAQAGDRKVHIELERLTARTTRMRITAKQGWFWRDRATAGEFIAQTERALDDMPAVSQQLR